MAEKFKLVLKRHKPLPTLLLRVEASKAKAQQLRPEDLQLSLQLIYKPGVLAVLPTPVAEVFFELSKGVARKYFGGLVKMRLRYSDEEITRGRAPLMIGQPKIYDRELAKKFEEKYGRHVFDEFSVHLGKLWARMRQPRIDFVSGKHETIPKTFMKEWHAMMTPVLPSPKEFLEIKLAYEKPRIVRERQISSKKELSALERFMRIERGRRRR